jgi:hypothetical protein
VDPITSGDAADPRGSKLGGPALLLPGEPWPRCPGCDRHMLLFIQIALDELPAEQPIAGAGLLQLFGCVTPTTKRPSMIGARTRG